MKYIDQIYPQSEPVIRLYFWTHICIVILTGTFPQVSPGRVVDGVSGHVEYSMCAHTGALKQFFGISAEGTIWILISVYVMTLLMNLFNFCN